MVGFWFFLIIVLALLALIGAAILSSMAANAAGNGNVSTGVSFSIWSAVLTALAAILIIIAAIVAWYRADVGSLKGSRLGWGFGLTIFIAILFLIGATILSIMSANSSDAASVKSNAIWAAVVTAVGGFIVLVGLFIAIYFGREEVGKAVIVQTKKAIYEVSDERAVAESRAKLVARAEKLKGDIKKLEEYTRDIETNRGILEGQRKELAYINQVLSKGKPVVVTAPLIAPVVPAVPAVTPAIGPTYAVMPQSQLLTLSPNYPQPVPKMLPGEYI